MNEWTKERKKEILNEESGSKWLMKSFIQAKFGSIKSYFCLKKPLEQQWRYFLLYEYDLNMYHVEILSCIFAV